MIAGLFVQPFSSQDLHADANLSACRNLPELSPIRQGCAPCKWRFTNTQKQPSPSPVGCGARCSLAAQLSNAQPVRAGHRLRRHDTIECPVTAVSCAPAASCARAWNQCLPSCSHKSRSAVHALQSVFAIKQGLSEVNSPARICTSPCNLL
jgi:hypothetical protein